MTTRNINKQLAAMEDLAQGIGTTNQVRGGIARTVHRIDVPVAVETQEEMQALDVEKFTRARVYSTATSFTDYIYDINATSGITSTGPGFWVPSLNKNKQVQFKTVNEAINFLNVSSIEGERVLILERNAWFDVVVSSESGNMRDVLQSSVDSDYKFKFYYDGGQVSASNFGDKTTETAQFALDNYPNVNFFGAWDFVKPNNGDWYAVTIPDNRNVFFDQSFIGTAQDNTHGDDFRAIVGATRAENIRVSGKGLFYGAFKDNSRTYSLAPKIGLLFTACKNCYCDDLLFDDFGLHGFAIYAARDLGLEGSENIFVTGINSKRGDQTSVMAYSSFLVHGSQVNKKIHFTDCIGDESGQFYGFELRGCINSTQTNCHAKDNALGGHNVEELSRNITYNDCTSDGGVHGFFIHGENAQASDRLRNITYNNPIVSNNTGTAFPNFAGDNVTINEGESDGASIGVNILDPSTAVPASALDPAKNVVVRDTKLLNCLNDGIISRGDGFTLDGGKVEGGVAVSGTNFKTFNKPDVDSYSFSSGAWAGGENVEVDDVNSAVIKRIYAAYTGTNEDIDIVGSRISDDKSHAGVRFKKSAPSAGQLHFLTMEADTLRSVGFLDKDGNLELTEGGGGVATQLIMKSPDGTRYKLEAPNGGGTATWVLP